MKQPDEHTNQSKQISLTVRELLGDTWIRGYCARNAIDQQFSHHLWRL
jgi:hypothetical protein